jgi:Ser/Thr protein kinase RdoA (MazF antagonist)
LIDLQRATRLTVTIDDRRLTELVREPCLRLLPSLPADLGQSLRDVESKISGLLLGRPFPLVQLHGDFKGSNLLWSEDERVSAVVDWDLAVQHYLPVIDFAFYMAYEQTDQGKTAFDLALADQIEPPSGVAYWRFAERDLGLTKTTYALCVLMALVRYATHHAGFLESSEHPEWCVRYVNSGLGRAVAHMTKILM